MGNVRDNVGKAGVVLASGFFGLLFMSAWQC